MGKGKRRSGRFEVEWITVSYRTIGTWVLVIGLVALTIGGIIFLSRIRAAGEEKEVERLLQSAERDLRDARERLGIPSRELDDAEGRLEQARRAFEHRAFEDTRQRVAEARDLMSRVSILPNEFAQLLQLEGQVQVKHADSLDWEAGRVGMALGPGDLVKTTSGAAAQMVNLDGSLVTLRSDTVLRIERSAKDRASGRTSVAVVVSSGQLTMATTEPGPPGSTSEVKTPGAAATLGGYSEVGVAVDEGRQLSSIDVRAGRADVAAGDERMELSANERLSVSPAGIERRRLPGTPVLLRPEQWKVILAHALKDEAVELEWESLRDARSYRVELARSALFTRLVGDQRVETNYLTMPIAGLGHYYWRVTAADRDGVEGGPSAASEFRISDAMPEGEPPRLDITYLQNLGGGTFQIKGRSQPACLVILDDGDRTQSKTVEPSGEFDFMVTLYREGRQLLTITARTSDGRERRIEEPVDVRLQ